MTEPTVDANRTTLIYLDVLGHIAPERSKRLVYTETDRATWREIDAGTKKIVAKDPKAGFDVPFGNEP